LLDWMGGCFDAAIEAGDARQILRIPPCRNLHLRACWRDSSRRRTMAE